MHWLANFPFHTPLTICDSIFSGAGAKRSDTELKSGIAKFYDESSGIWLDVWGEHMHHGYYPHKGYKNHEAAQIGMIDRSLGWAYGREAFTAAPKTMVDVGCGVGGSSRYICRRYGSDGVGVSLSPFQIGKAKEFTEKARKEGKSTMSESTPTLTLTLFQTLTNLR